MPRRTHVRRLKISCRGVIALDSYVACREARSSSKASAGRCSARLRSNHCPTRAMLQKESVGGVPACLLDPEPVREYERRVVELGDAAARRALGSEITLRWWLPVWWSSARSRLAPSTLAQYALQVRVRIEPYLGDLRVSEIDVAQLSVWLDQLRAAGHPDEQVARAQGVLSRCLHHAARRGLLPAGNPVHGLDSRPRKPRRRPRPLSPMQTEYLRLMLLTDTGRPGHALRGLRSAALVSLLAYGGLRPSEAMGAKVGNLDVGASGLWVSDVMSGEHRIDHTKTGQHRFLRLPGSAIEDLVLWIRTARLEDADGWLFPDRHGNVTRYTYPNWVDEIRRARVEVAARRPEWRAEFETLTPKTLRHTCASTRLRAGDPVAEVAADLGNSPAILLSWYTHEVRASRDAPVESLDSQISQARKELATPTAARRLVRMLRAPHRSRRPQRRRSPAASSELLLIGNRYSWGTGPDRPLRA